ncbi:MAG: hypothetical protein AVDCRST_MAG34-2018, partial [uncultured Nocardioidaceae bacterium]
GSRQPAGAGERAPQHEPHPRADVGDVSPRGEHRVAPGGRHDRCRLLRRRGAARLPDRTAGAGRDPRRGLVHGGCCHPRQVAPQLVGPPGLGPQHRGGLPALL